MALAQGPSVLSGVQSSEGVTGAGGSASQMASSGGTQAGAGCWQVSVPPHQELPPFWVA